jgi:hypothetical protein
MNFPIVLILDRSTPDRLCLERDGRAVNIEEAFARGFYVTREDAAAILTQAARFVENRDQFQK